MKGGGLAATPLEALGFSRHGSLGGRPGNADVTPLLLAEGGLLLKAHPVHGKKAPMPAHGRHGVAQQDVLVILGHGPSLLATGRS